MIWSELRTSYPNQWVLIEAVKAYTTVNKKREIEGISLLECCKDGLSAMQRYRDLHRQYPEREFYYVHTSRKELDIFEHNWMGIRRNDEVRAS